MPATYRIILQTQIPTPLGWDAIPAYPLTASTCLQVGTRRRRVRLDPNPIRSRHRRAPPFYIYFAACQQFPRAAPQRLYPILDTPYSLRPPSRLRRAGRAGCPQPAVNPINIRNSPDERTAEDSHPYLTTNGTACCPSLPPGRAGCPQPAVEPINIRTSLDILFSHRSTDGSGQPSLPKASPFLCVEVGRVVPNPPLTRLISVTHSTNGRLRTAIPPSIRLRPPLSPR